MAKIKIPGMTPALEFALEEKITSLEAENKYFEDFFDSIGESAISSSIHSPDGQIGVSIPRWYGLLNTFITNPSNVSIGIIDRMIKTDDTVLCAVHFKAAMMLSKIGEYQHEDSKIEDFVRGFLSKIRAPNWNQLLQSQASKGGYGMSVTEFMFGINKLGQKVPMRGRTYHPSTLCFEVDPWGEITEWGIVQFIIQSAQISNPNQYFPYFQYGYDVKNPFETPQDRLLPYRMSFINNYGLVRIWKHKCVHHVENDMLSFGSPYGNTGVRTAHLAWQMKVYVMRMLGIAIKRNAQPFIWATAPHNKNKVKVARKDNPNSFEDYNPIDAISKILRNRQQDDSVVTGPESEGYKVQAIINQCDLEQIVDVLKFLNTLIFRSFVIPSLAISDGDAGSRALGQSHFEIVDRMAEEDAKIFGDTIIDQLIRRSIVENFGEQDDYGNFAAKPHSLDEKEKLANIFNGLANSGWMSPLDKDQSDHVASVLDIPDKGDDFYNMPNPNDPNDPNSGDSPDEQDS